MKGNADMYNLGLRSGESNQIKIRHLEISDHISTCPFFQCKIKNIFFELSIFIQ